MNLRTLTLRQWDDTLPASGFEVFHSGDVLRVLRKYAPGELLLLGGFRGEQPVAMLPVFIRDLPFIRAIVSPPPGFSVPRMGPLLMESSPKRRKQQRVNREFTEAVIEALHVDGPRSTLGMVCSPEYVDLRPYTWAGFHIDTRYTFRIDLEDVTEDDVLMSFNRDLRSEIRSRDELDVSVAIEGADAAARVHRDLERRYAEQGIEFPPPRDFTRDLVAALDDARVYVARGPEGEYLSGITVLYSNDEAHFWQGGTGASYEGVSVNSLLHWRIIEDILTDPPLNSVSRYDLGSANNERLSRYKAKFNPELVPYYELKSDWLMVAAKKAHELIAY